MATFNKEEALITYRKLYTMHDDEIHDRPDFLEVLEARGSRGFHTDFDPVLEKLEAEAHRNGFFFWHHFEENEVGGEDLIYTIEEIKPTGAFDVERAEAHFNEIQMDAPGAALDEQGKIDYEAHCNGFAFEWNNDAQRYKCVPLCPEPVK